MFTITPAPLDPQALRQQVLDPAAGGFCCFEGWVRNHHEGREVLHLEYEAYHLLAEKEGSRILEEAKEKFGLTKASCAHRTGTIAIGGLAVVVCVSSAHRAAAFDACRNIINEVKARVPIWKKEFFANGDSGWVRCDHCAGNGHGH